MAEITNIRNSINTRVSTILGSNYNALAFVINHEKNNFKGNEFRYGVYAGPSVEVDGVISQVSFSQEFRVKLTDIYASIYDDSDKVASIDNLIEKCHAIYDDLIETKAGLSGTVINITNLVVNEAEILESSNVLMIEMSFNVLYRK